MGITLEEGTHLAEWVVARAASLGLRAGVAIVNERAGTVAVLGMDGSRPFTPDTAHGKALGTVLWGMSGSTLAGREASSVFQAVAGFYGNRIIYAEGSALLKRGDEVVGAIGVSGAAPKQDQELAEAAAAAFASGSL